MRSRTHPDPRPPLGPRTSSESTTLTATTLSHKSNSTATATSSFANHNPVVDTPRDDLQFTSPVNVAEFMNDGIQSGGSGRIRWAMLAATCFVLFGNYYAFDNPASLNQPLQEYMQMSDDSYAYFINILYTAYSLPNIVLPWLGGLASDKFGHRRLLIALSAIVALGHLIVCFGVESRNVPAMILGRVLFGAGESLAVAQSAITVKYFRGKELAMALGVNLCIARLGSVLNDILTPFIWARSNVPIAFWGGFVSCVLSFMTACLLVWMDMRFGSAAEAGFSRLPTHHSDVRVSVDTLDHSRGHGVLGVSNVGMSAAAYDPHTGERIGRKSFANEEVIDLEVMHDSSKILLLQDGGATARQNTNGDGSGAMDDSIDDDEAYGWDSDPGQANEYERHGLRDQTVLRSNADGLAGVRALREAENTTVWGHFIGIFVVFLDYTQSFWVLFAMTFLLIGVQVPFNTAQIMTVPDLLSAVLVLPVGYFVDHYGQKSWLFMLCGLVIGGSHAALGLLNLPSPVPALLALGIASAIGAIFNSAIPVMVESHQIATA
ncbi:hypothetical protein BGW38_002102 [Lunasporangiospora selenospora]|uniref:Lysosomal dipeptide transporter MFSD1 n=1 Tax=Lunasporangiospora selenospora TaxID=979761 RepID=A0A9P6FUN0_9FUNG|nr:hypothetical protein BGW38_002102 [Lunasporangiospora selenospora]